MRKAGVWWWAWRRAARAEGWQVSGYDIWREYRALQDYLDRQRRVSEWEALKHWWSCRERQDYARVRELCGNDLARALDKWHQTERYKRNKIMYKR